ncbi:ankyrin repeat-containing domain protein [Biscogniauxia mediterranea]|nr:ankyrin repeat-containing domain protein [Biscogniauxia mediterranea]
MAPNLSGDEIDDLIYLARAGEDVELAELLREISVRDHVTPAEVLAAARDDSNATCLHMAAANGHAKTVTLILSYLPSKSSGATAGTGAAAAATPTAGSDEPDSQAAPASEGTGTAETPYINVQNTFGNTALHWACLGGHLDVVKLLLSRGASPAAANDKDQIPLDLAAFNNHMHVVEFFLSQSKDIEGTNATENGGDGLAKGAGDVEMGDDDGVEENATGEQQQTGLNGDDSSKS